MTSRAVFSGFGASGTPNLWVTDGAAAGTSELTPAGAYEFGLLDLNPGDSPDFTALGGRILFEGVDASGHRNLWVTDGTSAGTSELTVAGADSAGLFYEIDPQFTALGNKALFVGADATRHSNLWITDGTSAGPHELAVGRGGTPMVSALSATRCCSKAGTSTGRAFCGSRTGRRQARAR